MNEPIRVPISREIVDSAAELARGCSSTTARERVLVSQSVAHAIREKLETDASLRTSNGRSADTKFSDLLDVCDFTAAGWRVEVRTVTPVERQGLYVPTMPLMVGVLSDVYLAVEVDTDLAHADLLGFATPEDLGAAELNANGLFAIVDREDLRPYDDLLAMLAQPKPIDLAHAEAFDAWQRRADRIVHAVDDILAADGEFDASHVERLAALLRDGILRIYGERLPETGLEPLFDRLFRRFGLRKPVPARPGGPVAFDVPHEERPLAASSATHDDYFRDALPVGERVNLYRHLLDDDAALTQHRRKRKALDVATGGTHLGTDRRKKQRSVVSSVSAETQSLDPPPRTSRPGTQPAGEPQGSQVLKPNAIVRGPFFPEPVQIIVTHPIGESTKIIGRGLNTGQVRELLLKPEQLAQLEVSPDTEPFDGDPARFRLGVEALRLGLAYEYDPYFSLSIARVDPLPHQVEAVYDYFMKLPRIRFLLADDPGAGKTVMAGLLLKELKIRGLVKRTLIVTPASLSFQWQREMKDKFREDFDVMRGENLRLQYGRNLWQERDQVITSVSWVSRIQDANESLLRSRWDLIIVDEAHKMSARKSDDPTLAYKLGQKLSEMTDHYLLMTATPHKGDPENFRRFLELLDKDVYADIQSLEEATRRHSAPFYLRRVKEALVTFPDPETGEVKKIFTNRNVDTAAFKLDETPNGEFDLYEALTDYVERQSVKAAADDSARGRALAFTMAMLQRRFASSIYAMRRSLERMREKREKILEDPEAWRKAQIEKRLPEDFDDLDDEERQKISEELESVVASVDPAALKQEIRQLGDLIARAQTLEAREVESKLVKLKSVLKEHGIFEDPKMKLLIFTEHKDTLDYLVGKLREWGLTVTQIHGGMKIGDRDTPGTRIHAEREFRENAQVLVATEAAGEGINLQFCWFMINYDIPWNPVRLEQRMGRIHRYGQEKDCLILNFVSTSTREGRVLEKLFERLRAIEEDLDKERTGKIFNVLGEVFPANQLERMLRDMYAHNLTEAAIKNRIVEQVDTAHFRKITNSALEGLAKRDLNLQAIMGKRTEAVERRLVPEVVEEFFKDAATLAGITVKEETRQKHVYRVGRVPRTLWTLGERLEPRYGKLGREYKQVVFDKELLRKDATLEWLTPGHPLFEVVREDVSERVRDDLQHGAVFYDLHSAEPYLLDVFTASIKDGKGNTLHRRLFVVQTGTDGEFQIKQPTIFFDLSVAPVATEVPAALRAPDRLLAEQALVSTALQPFLDEVAAERRRETDVVAKHIEISLGTIIDRVNLQYAELYAQKEAGSTEQGLDGRITTHENRLEDLNGRLERKRADLERERECAIGDVLHVGRAWVLPHPERSSPSLAPMVRDDEIERIAVEKAMEYERSRGWEVESVESENRGFDLISRRYHPEDPKTAVEVRFIEVKGRAGVGEVALTTNEYRKAEVVKADYWLYVVFNCATKPEIHTVQDPARLGWKPVSTVEHYRIGADQLLKSEH